MKDEHSIPAHDEQQLLQHYRTHSDGEPSAALDARILAAASAQAARHGKPAQRPAARLHAWLFGASGRTGWSVAFGSLALLGLGLGLSLNTLEPSAPTYDAPVPAAPAMQRYAAPAPMERKAMAEPEAASRAMVDSVVTEALQAPPLGADSPARNKVLAAPWQAELQEVLALRERGQEADARMLLDGIRERYPQLDVDKQLQQLQEANE